MSIEEKKPITVAEARKILEENLEDLDPLQRRVHDYIVRFTKLEADQGEKMVSELGGIKSLYSDAYYTPEEFWSIYNKHQYFSLKNRYDPRGQFKDIYAKCIQHE